MLASSGTEYVGEYGTGYFNQKGGTNTAGSGLYVAYGSGSVGNYTISGGTLNTSFLLFGTAGGPGTLTVSGTGVVNISEGIIATTSSTLVLSGGLLNIENNGIATAANPITTVVLPAPGQTAGIQSLGGMASTARALT